MKTPDGPGRRGFLPATRLKILYYVNKFAIVPAMSIPFSRFLSGLFSSATDDDTPVIPAGRAPALLVIDVQREFCDPRSRHKRGNRETAAISKLIRAEVPRFRQQGIPVYPVYFVDDLRAPDDTIDYYRFRPARGDTIIKKNRDSAFAGSNIKDVLRRAGHDTLLVCGFNLNACVNATVMDAVKAGFTVRLLRDLTGNDNDNDRSEAGSKLEKMRRNGVQITTAQAALQKLADAPAAANRAPPAP